MTKEITFNDRIKQISGYFSQRDLFYIVILAVLGILTSRYGLNNVLPGGGAPSFVHGFMKLPGPGAGIFISAAFICFWLVAGLLLIKKPGNSSFHGYSDGYHPTDYANRLVSQTGFRFC